MSLKTDRIENKALNGAEWKEIACQQFRKMLDNDCMFLPTIAYRRGSFTLQGTFHFGNPHPAHVVRSYTKPDEELEGEAPLKNPDEDAVFMSVEREVKLDNPNLARVHHDIPIKVERKVSQEILLPSTIPGEPPVYSLPHIAVDELRYDKAQFPEFPEPVQTDVTEAKAKQLGVPVKKGGMGYRK